MGTAVPGRKPGVVDKAILALAKGFFFTYAVIWLLKKRRISELKDVVDVFYFDFLRLERDDVEVVKLDSHEVVTRCRNSCPILSLSLRLNLETSYVCRVVSEPVCVYVLRKLRPDLEFERNYGRIRPYADDCEETIRLKHQDKK